MGRSKFPGKPSKLVNKKRVSVLQVSENNLINYDNDEYLSNDQISLWNHENETTTFGHDGDDVQDHPVSKTREKPPSSEPPDGGGKPKYSSTRNCNIGVVTRARNTSQNLQNLSNSTVLTSSSSTTILNTQTSTISSSSYLINKSDVSSKRDKSFASTDKQVKKKTVTFKNVLETSDDACAVRKVYNPDNAPLVSIIKKECLSRSVRLVRNDCIVRPSRLTEILKNNANNIDKLNFLKFRSSFPKEMESSVPSVTNMVTVGTITGGTTITSPTSTTVASVPSNSNESNSNNVTVGDKRFILPKRSAHSCRVIKPNKRFLVDVEMPTKSTKKATLLKDGSVGTTKRQLKKTFNIHQQHFNDMANVEDKNSRTSENSGSGSLQQDSFINNTLSHQINTSKLIEDNRSDENDDTSETSQFGTDDTQTDSTGAEEDELENNKTNRMYLNNTFTTGSMATVKSIFNSSSASKVILRQPRLQYDSQSLFNPHPSSCTNLTSTPFSLNFSSNASGASNLSLGNSNICGVCGTAINCKIFPQPRKYGIFSCEACRKFISKTIKKLASASGSPQPAHMLQCNKGDGSCVISPLHKGIIKNFKKTYKERCAACWLKKCTKSFHVPSGFKNRLYSIIPASLRDNESNTLATLTSFSIKKENVSTVIITTSTTSSATIASPSTTTSSITPLESETIPTISSISNSNLFASSPGKLISWSAESFADSIADKTLPLTNPLAENNSTFGGSPLIKPTILEKPVFLLNSAVCGTESEAAKKSKTFDSSKPTMIHSSQRKLSIEAADESLTNFNRIKLRRKDKDSPAQTQPIGCDPPKRQRIDLKGPRVKHVCRSASIVLGQPIATFPNESSTVLDSMDTPPRPESPNNAEVELTNAILSNQPTINCSTCTQENNVEQELGLSPPATPVDDNRAQDESSNEITDKIDIMDNNNSSNSYSNGEKENRKNEDQVPKPLTRKISRPAFTASNNLINATNPRNLNSFSKKLISEQSTPQKINVPPKISIDFWENYDPAEVCQTGFGIIVTESIPMRALCFLCGSTGLDPLIFCACCCEPYHSYCVEDEYNLKHSSLDDTMISLADASINPVENVSLITNRLNWLCPRCTVCYTCNMSSGSKVKCQKCQKNYHTTCLGTSKRLSGADRPLICANCLKCKSCSTTKVTKFVGNLPMCSQCFKLRKKGNFCPLCQKCYEDNDFDLKMMECGDCQRWVHAKCEGLSDEQYNLLSTLPENIEFICRKCSKANNQANLWRDAVAAEFKSGLLSVVKLLSKSRQACALLKLSPRKKSSANCTCQPQSMQTTRNLQFKKPDVHELNLSNDSKGTTDEESQNSEDINMNEDVYEFKENLSLKCFCDTSQKQLTSLSVPSLVEIKRKINFGDYVSLAEFNYDMNNVITLANCDELMITYKEILSEAFPWFQNETKACTDALEEDMFDSCTFSQPNDGVECDQQVPVIDLPEDIEDCLYSPNKNDDRRVCMFCKGIGEGEANQESRFLYCGQNSWVHINCAMWSAEVFEEIDGSLQNVHSAISRGRLIKCSSCGNRGATVGCNVKSCGEHYHYPCAKKSTCAFMTDKTVYCPVHLIESHKKQANIENSFEVLRPVYVELDRKKKKLVEPSKVKFLIGSLEVKKLGKVFPKVSDTNEAIIPVDFLCTRLYWSIKEPWKIVEYTVKTTIQSNMLPYACDNSRNFTVDHSGSNNKVEIEMTQIARWHNSLLLGEENESGFFRQERSVKQILEAVGQSGNTEEGTEEEPQNNADLLPPEIKDAIFEDLPHELLDGISMLDIFPKLMIYEDMIAIDNKTEGYYTNEYTKDGAISDEDGNDVQPEKDLELGNGWPNNSGVTHVEDALLSAVRPLANSREIKRSKSEVFSRSIGGNRSHQRSSSLTWSCKLENTSSASAIKRRKMSKGYSDIRLPESVLLSIGRRKDEYPVGIDRRRISQSEDCRTKQFTWSAAKKYTQNDIQDYASISRDTSDKLKISQLDGMDDITNESDYGEFQQLQSVYDPNSTESPVKCDRCNCTYRTHDSYQRHLSTCEPLSTSESESETAPRSPDMRSPLIQATHPLSMMQNFGTATLPITSIPNTQIMTSTNGIQTIGSSTTSIPTIQNVQIQNGIPMTQINQGISNIFLTTTQNSTQQQTSHQAMAPTVQPQQFLPTLQNLSQTVNSINQFTTVSNPTVSSTQTISISTNGIHQSQQQPQLLTMSTADGNQHVLTIGSQQASNLLNVHHNRTIGHTSLFQKPQIVRAQVERTQAKVRQLNKMQQSPNKMKTKPTNAAKPIQMKRSVTAMQQKAETANIGGHPVQIMNQSIPGIVRNQADNNQGIVLQQNTNSQPIIVQQVGNTSNNLLSYVTTADGHNSVQYVAVPTSNDFKQPQTPFLTNPLMQGTFLQADSSGNLVLTNASSGLQMLSAAPLQITQPAQPQVIGTLIQPQTAAIQCGVMSAEQMVLGSTPTLEMVTNPTMLLTSQPVYYGLETIVQNTVMSSQQFVSTAMQGVLSQNASFSATTTQVFQASKIEPIMEMPAGYVVLNNVDGTLMQQPTTQANIISTNVVQQPNIQQIHSQPQQIHTQTVQQQQINPQSIQSIYNIQQQTPQAQSQTILQHQPTIAQPTIQTHHLQPQLRAVSPAKPTAKSSPIVVTKIQPQIINKVVPNMSMASTATNIANQQHTVQEQQKLGNQIILSKSIAITTAGVDTNPRLIQTTATGAITKGAKSSPVSMSHHHPLKPKTNSINVNASLMPIQPVQRKMNMIRPLNKVISSSASSTSTAVTIKPKVMTKPVSSKLSGNGKNNLHSPPLIAPKPQQMTLNVQNQKLQQQQVVSRNGGAGGIGQVINEQQLLDARKNLQAQLAQADSTAEILEANDILNGVLGSQTLSTTVNNDIGKQANNLINIDAPQAQDVILNGQNVYPQNNFQYSVTSINQSQTINLPTSSSSIQLPSAPFVSPYGNNIPTNIVNPIQQVNNNNNNNTNTNNIISRPTNRVLPMQTIQNKLLSPTTPPESKLSISKREDKDIGQRNKLKEIVSSTLSSSSPQYELIEKEHITTMQQQSPSLVRRSDGCQTSIIHRHTDDEDEKIISIEVRINNEVITLDTGKNNSELKMILNDPHSEEENEFDMKPNSGGIPDQDDMSGDATPEVKEKICEILENLENEECNRSTTVGEAFNTNESMIQTSKNASKTDLLDQQKENVDPMQPETMNNVKTNSISPIKVSDFMGIHHTQCKEQQQLGSQKTSGPRLLYEIQSEDGFTYKSSSIMEVWEKVFEAVQVARKAHGLSPLPEGPLADMCGLQMLGLKTNALRYLIEQLPGVERCSKYTPKYHKREEQNVNDYFSDQEDLKENPCGAGRCETFSKRSDYDMFSWLASRHRKQPVHVVIQPPDNDLIPRRGTGSNLPMAMKYRTLKETYKDYVGVFRSHIHGRGLYCTKDIEAGEMVIEYAGELIRSTLTDKRERYYDSKGIGCYMFKIDENLVVDATMRGNAARFINHSCEPNCYSKVVDILGHKHIIIFALRRIVQGEELTYDYKFPFEDVKIPCSCGSKKCRKYLN